MYKNLYSRHLLVFSSGACSPEIRNAEMSPKKKKVVFQSCMEVGDILNFLKQHTSIHCDLVSENRVAFL